MNNFAQLSDGEDAKFLVRWRGRQEGPHPASVIEAKLAANEIGLLHEIYHDGKWLTIRDYVTERETDLRAEVQAREENERRTREETEKKNREAEEQRQAESLAEDRRQAAQRESVQRQQSHPESPQGSPLPPANRDPSDPRTFAIIGTLLLIGGLAVAGYFLLAFDTSVVSGSGRVNNLGLMADRQNGIIVGIGLGVVGTIMLTIGFRNRN